MQLCMAEGITVVLVNCESLYESLYDLLNQVPLSFSLRTRVRAAYLALRLWFSYARFSSMRAQFLPVAQFVLCFSRSTTRSTVGSCTCVWPLAPGNSSPHLCHARCAPSWCLLLASRSRSAACPIPPADPSASFVFRCTRAARVCARSTAASASWSWWRSTTRTTAWRRRCSTASRSRCVKFWSLPFGACHPCYS
jgi:hypothetical protein